MCVFLNWFRRLNVSLNHASWMAQSSFHSTVFPELGCLGGVQDLWSSSTLAQIQLRSYLLEAFSFRNYLVLLWVLSGNTHTQTPAPSEPQVLRPHHVYGVSLGTGSVSPKFLERCPAFPLWHLPFSAGIGALRPPLSLWASSATFPRLVSVGVSLKLGFHPSPLCPQNTSDSTWVSDLEWPLWVTDSLN